MAKKKRQGEPSNNGNSCDSSESSEDMFMSPSFSDCKHVAKAVDLNRVKKVLNLSKLCTECEECKALPQPPEEPSVSSDLFDFSAVGDSLWMCLKCGHLACGRYKNKHALMHYNTPHSDKHSLCLNTSTWCVWCYHCDNEVKIDGKKKKLHECVEYIKKIAESASKPQEASTLNNATSSQEQAILVMSKPTVSISSNNGSEFVARGLSNLGNTCFFNSVMQCLGQTPYLLSLLEETAVNGQQFRLPGGKVMLEDDKVSIVVEPLEGTLEEWKTLTRVLAETLRELQSGRVEVHNPRGLFQALTQRMSQFGGGDQHDSHELLRHLLDAVREEDLRRYQHVILKHLGLNLKTDPATVEGDKRKIIRFYGSQASDLLLPTEQVFRGVLVSTLECQMCGHRSYREEFFLDLSLPIAEKVRPPELRRKADDKKDRRAARKSGKRGRSHEASSTNSVAIDDNQDVPMEAKNDIPKSASESDADIEDNVEDSGNSRTPDEGTTKGTESGYNSDHADLVADDVASSTVGMLSALPFSPDSPTTSPGSSETNLDVGSPAGGPNSPTEQNLDHERPESRLAFVGLRNVLSLENLSIEQDGKPEVDGAFGGDTGIDSIGDAYTEMDIDDGDIKGTISVPVIEDSEYSVLSCLNQFTTSELMTGNNKVGCELCTKRHGGTDKKTVYTNATKQLLIYNPPAVLILHLKRFQVYHFRPSKIGTFVKFPTQLDIAPFCTKRALKLPTLEADQKQVLYSLYGVVEHSGFLHGGHYVAYIKVRPHLEEGNYRWQFLPKNHRNNLQKKVEDANISRGKWFYVSDSHAAEVNESRVLNANAYLLFYERIL